MKETDWQSNRHFMSILNGLTEALVVINNDWRIIYANAIALNYFKENLKTNKRMLLQKGLWEIVPQLAGTIVYKKFYEARRTGKAQHFSFKSLFIKEKVWEIYSIPFVDGLIVYWQDLSSKEEQEETIAKLSQYLQIGERIAKIGTWDIDPATSKVHWSEGMSEIFEIQIDEFTNDVYEIINQRIHPDDREIAIHALKQNLMNKIVEPIQFRLIMPDGRIKTVQIKGEAIIDSSGNLTQLIGTAQDITEVKLLEEENDKIKTEFEQKRIAAVFEGMENERLRIASDLHDGLGQILNMTKLCVGTGTLTTPQLDRLNLLIDEAIQETKRITENLIPAKLQDMNLDVCIKSLCNQLSHELPIVFNFTASGSYSHLGHLQKINLYRIVQEALNNISKHAKATEVSIQMNADRSKLEISIEDNGCGFVVSKDITHLRTGNGFYNMQSRVKSMRGSFIVESSPSNGTLIIVEIPLD